MKRTVSVAALALMAFSRNALSQALDPEPAFRTRVADARLATGGKEIAPRRTVAAVEREESIGPHRIVVNLAEIRGFMDGGTEPAWTSKVDAGHGVWALAGAGDLACVRTYLAEPDGRFKGVDPDARVRVLDLRTGTWKADLAFGEVKGDDAKRLSISAVSAHEDNVVAISLWGRPADGENKRAEVTQYQVDGFAAGNPAPAWSRRFELGQRREYDGAYVWGIQGPRYANSELQPVTWMDETVLVCAEARQPILMLSRASGRTVWELDRVWEFQRGYIGPSVYSYFIGRFGQSTRDESESLDLSKSRKDFEKRWRASIIGGPVVVPLNFVRGGDRFSIFIAVLLAPADGSSYLADCVLFEFNEHAEPISIGKLPQMVDGRAFAVADGGCVWRGFNESFVRVAPAPRKPVVEMGGGGPDCTGRIDWFRQSSPRQGAPWFASPAYGDPVAMGRRFAVTAGGGGIVAEKDSRVYAFPLEAVSFADGTTRSLVVNVPFDDAFPLPTMNYRSDGRTTTSTGPYLMAVTGLELHDDILAVTLGRTGGVDVVEFDLSMLPLFASLDAGDPATGRAAVAAKRVRELKDVNARGERGQTPLFEAVYDLESASAPGK